MQEFVLRSASCSLNQQTQIAHFLSSYTKQPVTFLKFKRKPRSVVIHECNDNLVLHTTHEGVVYELMNKSDVEKHQVCGQEDIITTDDFCRNHVENNNLRWRFICRVYAILAAQISFCLVVSTFICVCVPVKLLLSRIHPVIAIAIALLPFIISWPLAIFRKQYPLNAVLLAVLTACFTIDIAICCAAMKVKIVLQALLVTMAGVSSLTGYTFYASRQGKSFGYLRPFLSACLAILLVTGVIQLFFPLVSKGNAIYAGVVAVVFSGYVVYDTDSMIRHYKYNEHITASVNIFLDIVMFFLSNLDLLQYFGELFT